jgi:hypothetical protein
LKGVTGGDDHYVEPGGDDNPDECGHRLDCLLDMARSSLTVFADAACSVIVARLEGK